MALRDIWMSKKDEVRDEEARAQMAELEKAFRKTLGSIAMSPVPIRTSTYGDYILGIDPAKSEEDRHKQKLAELEALKVKEAEQAAAEASYWQRREDELANIKVDKSAPFLGLSEVMMMLKPRR